MQLIVRYCSKATRVFAALLLLSKMLASLMESVPPSPLDVSTFLIVWLPNGPKSGQYKRLSSGNPVLSWWLARLLLLNLFGNSLPNYALLVSIRIPWLLSKLWRLFMKRWIRGEDTLWSLLLIVVRLLSPLTSYWKIFLSIPKILQHCILISILDKLVFSLMILILSILWLLNWFHCSRLFVMSFLLELTSKVHLCLLCSRLLS